MAAISYAGTASCMDSTDSVSRIPYSQTTHGTFDCPRLLVMPPVTARDYLARLHRALATEPTDGELLEVEKMPVPSRLCYERPRVHRPIGREQGIGTRNFHK